jgi:hypothetical protein
MVRVLLFILAVWPEGVLHLEHLIRMYSVAIMAMEAPIHILETISFGCVIALPSGEQGA